MISLLVELISVFVKRLVHPQFCEVILPNRPATVFQKSDVMYDVGEKERTFSFLLSGFVKVGTITVAEADFRTGSIARASLEKESLSRPGYGIRRSGGS
jgi:hypothetical protein